MNDSEAEFKKEERINLRCPNCSNKEFVYRRIPEEKSRNISYKPRKKLKIKPDTFHVSVIYCVSC